MAPRSTTETFFFFGDSLTLGVNDNAMPGGWVSRLGLLGSRAGWYDMPPALGAVLLICPPPVKEPAMRQRIASLCEAYVTACARKGHPCADVHAALAASPEYMDDLEDGLHPGPQGSALMARLLAEVPAVRRFFLTAKQDD